MRIHLSPPRALALAAVVVAPFVFALTTPAAHAAEATPAPRSLPAEIAEARAEAEKDKNAFRYWSLGNLLIEANQLDAAEKIAATMDGLSDNTSEAAELRADIAIARKDIPAALKICDELLAAKPDEGGIVAKRGRVKFTHNLADRGSADFDRAIQLTDNNDTDSLVFRSQLRVQQNDIAGAAVDLTRVLTLQAGRNEARVLRASHYLTLKIRNLALLDAEILLEDSPADATFLELKKRAEALLELQPAATHARITEALRQSADALLKGNAAAAERAFNVATVFNQSFDPGDSDKPALFIERGDLLLAGKANDLARYDYGNAWAGDRRVPAAYARIARIELAAKDYAGVLQTVEAIDPGMNLDDAADALVTAARAHLALVTGDGKTESIRAGLQALETARNYSPKIADPIELRQAFVAARRKWTDAMRAQFQETPIPTAIASALEAAKNGNPAESRQIFDRLQQRYPTEPTIYEARLRAGKDYRIETNRIDLRYIVAELRGPPAAPGNDPIDLANGEVHRRPYLSRPYIERSKMRLRLARKATIKTRALDQVKLATEDAVRAITIDPYDPQSHVAMAETRIAELSYTNPAQIYAVIGLRNYASSEGDSALALAQNDVALLLWRGDLARTHGPKILSRETEALHFYALACRVDPGSIRALILHAQSSSKLGNYVDAIADYRRIRQLDPANDYALYELGVAQLYAGSYTEAAGSFAALQKALAITDETRFSADSIESQQLYAVALAAAGDDAFEPVAKAVLANAQWIGNAGNALHNLRNKPHAKQLDQLAAMRETKNPKIQDTRENVTPMTLDAGPR